MEKKYQTKNPVKQIDKLTSVQPYWLTTARRRATPATLKKPTFDRSFLKESLSLLLPFASIPRQGEKCWFVFQLLGKIFPLVNLRHTDMSRQSVGVGVKSETMFVFTLPFKIYGFYGPRT